MNYLESTKIIHPDSIREIDELRALISEGNRLKGFPESQTIFGEAHRSGLAIPIISQIDSWLEKSINHIYSLLPKTTVDSEFTEISSIKNSFGSRILTASFIRYEKINAVLHVLHLCLNFVIWMTQFDENRLNHKQKAEFYFVSLEGVIQYVFKEMVSSLVGIEDGRTKRTALLHLYGRILPLARNIVKLNDVVCCQLLVASLRGLLELYVDMLLINKSVINNDLEKFYSFYEIYKFNSANKLLTIDAEIKTPKKDSSTLSGYLEREDQITQSANKLWNKKPKQVRHWTDKSLECRAREVGKLRIFRDIYYYGNMCVHSGYVEFPKTEDEAYLLCAHVYSLSSEILKEATELICSETEITQKEEIEQETNMIYLFSGYFHIWKSLTQT